MRFFLHPKEFQDSDWRLELCSSLQLRPRARSEREAIPLRMPFLVKVDVTTILMPSSGCLMGMHNALKMGIRLNPLDEHAIESAVQ